MPEDAGAGAQGGQVVPAPPGVVAPRPGDNPPQRLGQQPGQPGTPQTSAPPLPEVFIVPLPPLPRAGVELAKWVLVMMSAFIVMMLGLLLWTEWRGEKTLQTAFQVANHRVGPDTARTDSLSGGQAAMATALRDVGAQQKEFREFWFKTVQTVLLNTLLPVLTALLGYIFANRSGERAADPERPRVPAPATAS